MKRTSFVFVALLALPATSLSAQGLEFSGGVNFSQLSSDAIENAARNTGLNFGLDFVIPVGPIGLNLGGAWSQKGVEESDDGSTSVIDLSYIELPIHVRFPIAGAGPIRLNLMLGPTIGINTGCEVSLDSGPSEDCLDASEGAFDAKKLEWAGAAGLGLSFSLGGLAYAGVDLEYALGLSNVTEGSDLDAKNRTFTLTSHVGFDIF